MVHQTTIKSITKGNVLYQTIERITEGSILRPTNSTRSRKPASNPVEPAHQKPRYRLHFTWRNVIDRNRDELHWNVGRESIVAGSPIR